MLIKIYGENFKAFTAHWPTTILLFYEKIKKVVISKINFFFLLYIVRSFIKICDKIYIYIYIHRWPLNEAEIINHRCEMNQECMGANDWRLGNKRSSHRLLSTYVIALKINLKIIKNFCQRIQASSTRPFISLNH